MTIKTLLIIILSTVLSAFSYSQKLKLRIDIGNSVNFSSSRPTLFSTEHQEQIPSSEYTYSILPRCSLWNMPTNFALSLEFDYKRKNHLSLGFALGEILSFGDRLTYNYAGNYRDSLGYIHTGFSNHGDLSEMNVYKLNISYSRDFGKSWFRFSPIVGLSYLWVSDVEPYLDVGYTISSDTKDAMFPSSDLSFISKDRFTEHTSTMMGLIGVNFRFHSKKRELFAIKLYYEQGFRAVIQKQTTVYRNSNKFSHNMLYIYGSAFYIKLSVPIPVYNFVDHKWGR